MAIHRNAKQNKETKNIEQNKQHIFNCGQATNIQSNTRDGQNA